MFDHKGQSKYVTVLYWPGAAVLRFSQTAFN